MIEGLKLDFSGKELKAHLQAKASHHNERRNFYEGQAKSLQSGGAEAMQYTNGDPVKALLDKAQQHSHKSQMFILLETHVNTEEIYRLEDKDLTRLELISIGYW